MRLAIACIEYDAPVNVSVVAVDPYTKEPIPARVDPPVVKPGTVVTVDITRQESVLLMLTIKDDTPATQTKQAQADPVRALYDRQGIIPRQQ